MSNWVGGANPAGTAGKGRQQLSVLLWHEGCAVKMLARGRPHLVTGTRGPSVLRGATAWPTAVQDQCRRH